MSEWTNWSGYLKFTPHLIRKPAHEAVKFSFTLWASMHRTMVAVGVSLLGALLVLAWLAR